LFPLLFILSVTAIKDLLEDLSRRSSDKLENGRIIEIYDHIQQQKFIKKKWSDVVNGDIIKLYNREMIPADIVMIGSSTEGGLVYVSTANLDGETNLKLRKVHENINIIDNYTNNKKNKRKLSKKEQILRNQRIARGEESDDDDDDDDDNQMTILIDGCRSLRESTIDCEQPNKYLHTFNGTFNCSDHFMISNYSKKSKTTRTLSNVSLSREHILLRSCQIRNTKYVVGVVVSTGIDTKIQQNISPAPFKTSTLMRDTNKLVGTAFLSMVIICLICSIMSYVYHSTTSKATYLGHEDVSEETISTEVQTVFQFFTFIIIFGNFVPISLYVTLDVVKYIQSLFINWDIDICDDATNTYTQVKSLDLNEELGSVNHIFSDKTGTLTCNIMEFMKCSINGMFLCLCCRSSCCCCFNFFLTFFPFFFV
jgi:phospholipid-transporting ATPase